MTEEKPSWPMAAVNLLAFAIGLVVGVAIAGAAIHTLWECFLWGWAQIESFGS